MKTDAFEHARQMCRDATARETEAETAMRAGARQNHAIGYREGVEAAARLLEMMPAGTTAAEAATAVRGSLSPARIAFTNFTFTSDPSPPHAMATGGEIAWDSGAAPPDPLEAAILSSARLEDIERFDDPIDRAYLHGAEDVIEAVLSVHPNLRAGPIGDWLRKKVADREA